MADAHEVYTHGHHESVLRSHSWRSAENSAAHLLPLLTPGMALLDLGCGPGTITVDLARLVSPGRVVGVDASASVIEDAAGLAVSSGLPAVRFQVGDAYALDFPDESFDVVHIHQLLHHLARPVAALREARRVLKPGGILAVREVDYGGTRWAPALPGLDDWLRVYEVVHRGNGGDPDAGRWLKGWVLEAGFGSVDAGSSVWCFSSDADREWWGGSWAERATESSFAAHAVRNGHADLAELRAIAGAWRDWAAARDGWLSMPHGTVVARR